MTATAPDLRHETVHGIKWTLGGRFLAQIAQYAISVALARLLVPEVFGTIAMVGALTGFAGILIDFGVGPAIVQRRALTEGEADSAFIVSLLVGLVVATLVLGGAPFVASFYGRSALTAIARASSITLLLGAIGVVPRALLQRSMRQKELALIDLAGGLAGAGVSVIGALAGYGVWALVTGGIVAAAVQCLSPLLVGNWRPGRWAAPSVMAPMLRVSLNLLGFNILNYWARNIDSVLIGRALGERDVGLYVRAYSLMLLPMVQINAVLAASLVPALSRVQDDLPRAAGIYRRAIGAIGLVSFPMMLGLAVVAGPFVDLVYGPYWRDLAPLVSALAVVGALQSITSTTGWVFLSQGRTDIMFRWGALISVCAIVVIALAVRSGSILVVAYSYLGLNLVVVLPNFVMASRLLDFGLRELAKAVGPSALGSLVMAGGVFSLSLLLPEGMPAGYRLGIEVAAGVVLYSVAMRALDPSSIDDLLGLTGWKGRAQGARRD